MRHCFIIMCSQKYNTPSYHIWLAIYLPHHVLSQSALFLSFLLTIQYILSHHHVSMKFHRRGTKKTLKLADLTSNLGSITILYLTHSLKWLRKCIFYERNCKLGNWEETKMITLTSCTNVQLKWVEFLRFLQKSCV